MQSIALTQDFSKGYSMLVKKKKKKENKQQNKKIPKIMNDNPQEP